MNIQKMMAEAQKLQKKMQEQNDAFDAKLFEVKFKEYITIKIYGNCKIKEIVIADELIDPDDKDTLQDIIAEALNDAIGQVQDAKEEINAKLMPGMPGGF